MRNDPACVAHSILLISMVTLCALGLAVSAIAAESDAVALPQGVSAVWDMARCHRETTPTRQRICLNGLWYWQPADAEAAVPAARWGYFKVPGSWPGITDYMQKDSQTLYAHPSWKDQRLASVSAAWYQREFAVPEQWSGRRIALATDYLNSYAIVYIDGAKAGEIRFPGGELDLTSICRPGAKHVLSMLVTALPLKGVLLSYTDSASARQVKGSVARRGLCGDVYLVSTPPAARISDVRIETSVRKWAITFDAAVAGIGNAKYTLDAQISDANGVVARLGSDPFGPADLKDGRVTFTRAWKPAKLWDTHTPANQYSLQLSLQDAAGKVLDTAWSGQIGFREFWIDGRDFYLNGTRIFLSALPLDNAQVGAAWASYDAARESIRRLKSFGVNFVYTHNYGCEPGSHLSFAEILRAADDEGMLVALSQPHFSHYDWKQADADSANGYATHARFYVGVAGNHPAIVAYSMSHNATGYAQDMNPDMIDGIQAPRENWSANNVKLATRAEAIVRRIDPGRIVYHHASGNLSSMHVINFYANFAPIQEMSDWFEHWATKGVKPVFTCEYAVPFTWDWTMYRGWYKGQREFGSAVVPWELCIAEWNSQFLGDRAFDVSENVKINLRWEAKQAQAGKLWHRWDYPIQVGSARQEEYFPVLAVYTTDNWRAFRTWGVSATSQWECGAYWKLRDGVDKARKALKVDWADLQRPGFSADYLDQRYERMDLAFEQSDWLPTPAAAALIRNNQPLLAYIAGKPSAFTSKDHNVRPGQSLEKQIIIINNSRRTVTATYSWSQAQGLASVEIPTGEQKRIPIRFDVPSDMKPGSYKLSAAVTFSEGSPAQSDSFTVDVMPAASSARSPGDVGKVAVFDPKGETAGLLKGMGVAFTPVDAAADLSSFDTLVVGKAALSPAGAAPDITRVRDGLKVIVFEQTAEALEKRLGFRVAEYGLRTVFRRIPNHPLLEGLSDEHLRDWAGSSTIQPPQLKYEMDPRRGISVRWCDIPVTRLWRCGNRGNVASVLIEKPACGNFLPVLDGGYSLQYSPLMLYQEGRGMVLFCQVDLTGRTEPDVAAQLLAGNIVRYVSSWKPSPMSSPQVLYAGDAAGRSHLESAGVSVSPYEGGEIHANQVLVAGPGAGAKLTTSMPHIAAWLQAGGHMLALGQDARGASSFLPVKLTTRKAEHIAAFFDAPPADSPFAGISPADVHNRDPRDLPLVSSDDAVGVAALGDGVLAATKSGHVVFCQLLPWEFGDPSHYHLKRTYRRSSFLLSRLLGNMGAASQTPLLSRFGEALKPGQEARFLKGLYLDKPEEWDDPYRFFRW